MARDVSEITDALREAAEGKSDSSDGPVKEEVEANADTPKDDSEAEPKAADDDGKKDQRVPYDRFKEVNDKANSQSETIESLEAKLAERDEEVGKLIDLVEAREYHSKVIDKINELHEDPRYTDIIDTLDKAIRGVEQDVESGKVTEEEGAAKADQAFKALAEDLEERLADNQAELILTKYDLMVEKYFDGLPDEYTDKDKELVNRILVDEVNWESIEEDPEHLANAVAEGLEKSLKIYGDPKGKAAPQADEPSDDPKQTPEPSAEDIAGLDWGKLKDIQMPDGQTMKAPEASEEEFAHAMASVMRKVREG